MAPQDATREPRPTPRWPRGTCFAWEPSRIRRTGPMLGGTGPVLCVLLLSVLGLTIPIVTWAGSPVEDYLAEQRAAAGLSPLYSIPDSTIRMPKMERTAEEQFLEADLAALESELDARLFAPTHDTVGFARRYQRPSNPFADGYASMQGGAFDPAARNDPDNPLNSMNRYNRNNPFNPMNETDPRNPASGFNRGVYGLPFQPLR